MTCLKQLGALMTMAALLTTTGCKGNGSAEPPASPTTTSSAPGVQRFATVAALKDAAVAAGLPCPAWKQDNVVQYAAESGTCSDSDVLSTYATDTDLAHALNDLRELKELVEEQGGQPQAVLVGSNWIINAKQAPALAEVLGGTIEQ